MLPNTRQVEAHSPQASNASASGAIQELFGSDETNLAFQPCAGSAGRLAADYSQTLSGSQGWSAPMAKPIFLLLLAVVAGCTSELPARQPSAKIAVQPLQIADASFTTRGPKFATGLFTMVQLCVGPNGGIVSASIVQSSGEKRFDDFVIVYARQVHVQPRRENGRAVASCDTVRVEVNHFPLPGVSLGLDNALG
jgi:TonB family protein